MTVTSQERYRNPVIQRGNERGKQCIRPLAPHTNLRLDRRLIGPFRV
jgi:hypothetical protein